MNARRSTREGHIEPIVDDDLGRRPMRDVQDAADQIDQPGRIDIALPHLDDVDTGVDGRARQLEQADPVPSKVTAPWRQPVPAGHEADEGMVTAHRDVPASRTASQDRPTRRTS